MWKVKLPHNIVLFACSKRERLVQDANVSNWFTAQISAYCSFVVKLLSDHLQISQTGESLAKAINCVAQSNLNFTGENLRLLTTELTKPLQTQVEQSVRIQIKMSVCYIQRTAFFDKTFIFDSGNKLISEQPHSLVCRTSSWELHIWKSCWCGVHEILVPNQDEASAAQHFKRIPVLPRHP